MTSSTTGITDKELTEEDIAKREKEQVEAGKEKLAFESATQQALQDSASIPIPKTDLVVEGGKGKKGKKTKGGSKKVDNNNIDLSTTSGGNPKDISNMVKCSNCNNPLPEDGKGIATEKANIKIPKNPETGKYLYESPGMPQGEFGAKFCSTCATNPQRKSDGTLAIDIKTVIVKRSDGKVLNIPVRNLNG